LLLNNLAGAFAREKLAFSLQFCRNFLKKNAKFGCARGRGRSTPRGTPRAGPAPARSRIWHFCFQKLRQNCKIRLANALPQEKLSSTKRRRALPQPCFCRAFLVAMCWPLFCFFCVIFEKQKSQIRLRAGAGPGGRERTGGVRASRDPHRVEI